MYLFYTGLLDSVELSVFVCECGFAGLVNSHNKPLQNLPFPVP